MSNFYPLPRELHPDFRTLNEKPMGAVQIREGHWSAKGLEAYGLNEVDLVSKQVSPFYGNIPSRTADYMHFNESRNSETIIVESLGNTWLNLATEFTMMIVCRFHGGSNSDEDRFFGQWSGLQGSSSADQQRALFTYVSNSPEVEFVVRMETGDVGGIVVNGSIDDGEFHVFIGTLHEGFVNLYIDGVRNLGDAASAIRGTSHGKFPEVMGGHATTDSTNDSPRFDLMSWGMWDFGMTPAEALSITNDQYQMLEPISNPYGYFVSEVGGFQAAWARNANTILRAG